MRTTRQLSITLPNGMADADVRHVADKDRRAARFLDDDGLNIGDGFD